MQFALFAAIAILVYLLSHWIVGSVEKRRDNSLPNKQIVFFIVFFALILLSFEVLKFLLADLG